MALKFVIQAGLLGVPVKLDAGARAQRVSLNMVYKGAGVSQKLVSKATGQEVSKSDTDKGFEVEPGKFVVLPAEELKALTPKSEQTITLEEFVPEDSVDPIMFESSWYVSPDAIGAKSYALLYDSLKSSKRMGVGKCTLSGREQVVLLKASINGLVLFSMFYASEVRATREYRPDLSILSDKERAMASAFVSAMSVPFFDASRFSDTHSASLKALIERKRSEAAGIAPVEVETPAAAPPDLMAQLRESIRRLGRIELVQTETRYQPASSLLDEIVEAAK
jgi:DNA end-binding protein Ku